MTSISFGGATALIPGDGLGTSSASTCVPALCVYAMQDRWMEES